METIYTILFTAPHMEPLLFAASTRTRLASKVRDHVNQLIAMHNEENSDEAASVPLGQYTDLDTGARWLSEMYGYEYEVEAHTEDE